MKCTINFLRNSLRFVPKVIVSFCIPILHSSTFCHLMGRGDSLEKTLLLGKIEGRRRRGQQRTRRLDGITDSVDMSLSKCSRGRTERPGVLQVAKSGGKESDTTKQQQHSHEHKRGASFPSSSVVNNPHFSILA